MAFGLVWVSVFSVLVWFYTFCSVAVIWNVLCTSFYVHVFGVLAVVIAVHHFKLPGPSEEAVREVLGPEPSLIDLDPDGLANVDNVVHGPTNNKTKKPYCMRVVAHRGACLDAPENSIAAFKLAKEKGCTAVEFDLAFTADDKAILFHDDKVDRITNGTGYVAQMTWEQLKDLSISEKHPFGDKFPKERIALFEDAVKECLRLDLRMIIDVKDSEQRAINTIVEAFASCSSLYKRAIVASFNPLLIYKLRKEDPKIVCGVTWRPHYVAFETYSGVLGQRHPRYSNIFVHLVAMLADVILAWAFRVCFAPIIGVGCVLVHKDALYSSDVQRWRNNGVRTIAWTVNQPVDKHFCANTLRIPYITDTLDGDPLLGQTSSIPTTTL